MCTAANTAVCCCYCCCAAAEVSYVASRLFTNETTKNNILEKSIEISKFEKQFGVFQLTCSSQGGETQPLAK